MGKKPWLISALMLGLGVVFTGCTSTNAPKDTTATKFKGSTESTFSTKTNANGNTTGGQPPSNLQTNAIGQPATGTGTVGDLRPSGSNTNAMPTQFSTDSHFAAAPEPSSSMPANSMTLVPPPPPSTSPLPATVQQTNRMPNEQIHAVTNGGPQTTLGPDDHADKAAMSIPTYAPTTPPGNPLPVITASGSDTTPPPPAIPSSGPASFNPPASVPPPPLGTGLSGTAPSGASSASVPVPALPPMPVPAGK
jgi:hypothetical protein